MSARNEVIRDIFDKYHISNADRMSVVRSLLQEKRTKKKTKKLENPSTGALHLLRTEELEDEIEHAFTDELETEALCDEKGEVSFYDIFNELQSSLKEASDYCEILKRRLDEDRKLVDIDEVEKKL